MKFSRLGYIMIGIAVITLILGVALQNFDGLLTEISVPLVSFFLTLTAYQIFKATKDRGTLESKTWLFMFIGSLFHLAVMLLMSIEIMLDITYTMPLYILEVALVGLSYLAMIVGLIYSFRHYSNKRKGNPWIPFIIIAVISVVAMFVSFRHFSQHHFTMVLIMPFIIYFLSDVILLYFASRNASITWGGKLSPSYLLMVVSFSFFIINNIVITLVMDSSTLAAGIPLYQPLYIVALTFLGLALDNRLVVEKELYTDSTPLVD